MIFISQLCRITECLTDVSVQSGIQVTEEHFSLALDVLYSEARVSHCIALQYYCYSLHDAAGCHTITIMVGGIYIRYKQSHTIWILIIVMHYRQLRHAFKTTLPFTVQL